MIAPPVWLADPRSADEAATGRRAAKAHRKAVRVATSVLAQCDACGCTDDVQDRLGRMGHTGCGGTFRLYGTAR